MCDMPCPFARCLRVNQSHVQVSQELYDKMSCAGRGERDRGQRGRVVGGTHKGRAHKNENSGRTGSMKQGRVASQGKRVGPGKQERPLP